MSNVTMLKLIIFYKKGLVVIYKTFLKRLILPLQFKGMFKITIERLETSKEL